MGNSESASREPTRYQPDMLELDEEELPVMDRMHQVEDGTIFYYHADERDGMRLYVKTEGREIDAALPDKNIRSVRAFGNAMYFCSDIIKKVYKAVFIAPGTINVSEVRDMLPDETIIGGGLCTRVRYGNNYVYRLCDDPETGAVFVDVSNAVLKKLELICVHRGKAIYEANNGDGSRPSIVKLRDNVIVVEISQFCLPFAQDSSPFIYFTDRTYPAAYLHALNTTTMQFLPPLEIGESFHICMIAGIHKEVITLWARTDLFDSPASKLTARLPGSHVASVECSLDDLGEESSTISDHFISKMTTEFEISKVLGVGGFGVVFEAKNDIDSWKYAVKRISIDPKNEKAALNEARSMAELDHSGIVRYNSAWIERPPEGWQLCKYSLARWLSDNIDPSKRPLFRMKMVGQIKQMVAALAYIHEKNLIHRDLKPANILFVDNDHLKLCDLGIATQRSAEGGEETDLTRTSIGTKMYMSPEQRSLISKYSSKTDVFSLGLILAEICIVMTSDDRLQIFDAYRSGTPTAVFEDAETTAFVDMLTQVDPTNRPTCQEILAHQYLASV